MLGSWLATLSVNLSSLLNACVLSTSHNAVIHLKGLLVSLMDSLLSSQLRFPIANVFLSLMCGAHMSPVSCQGKQMLQLGAFEDRRLPCNSYLSARGEHVGWIHSKYFQMQRRLLEGSNSSHHMSPNLLSLTVLALTFGLNSFQDS